MSQQIPMAECPGCKRMIDCDDFHEYGAFHVMLCEDCIEYNEKVSVDQDDMIHERVDVEV